MLLGQLPDLRDTQAGKELIAIGIKEGIKEGIREGIEEGLEKGTLIGTIRTCRSVLGIEAMEEASLISKSIAELKELAGELQEQVRNRFGSN
ncbi:hypothetical protein SH449x_005260 [Pirellulaceae bacterium SH449]